MLDEKNPQHEKEQPAPHGYYARPIGEGLVLYLSEREREQTEHQHRRPRRYYRVGQRTRRWWLAFCQWLRRYAVVGAMFATIVYAVYAGLQWGAMQGQFTTTQGQLTEMQAANRTASEARDNMQGQLDAMRESNAQNEKVFQATQHAAVYLGLPNGRSMDLAFRGKEQRLVLYFRNYGASTAQNMTVEVWSVTTSPHHRSVTRTFPARPGESSHPHGVGPDIPPGFQHAEYFLYTDSSRKSLETGQNTLKIIGRIMYADSFGPYCETFSAVYQASPVKAFVLKAKYGELCDGRPHEILFCYHFHPVPMMQEIEPLDNTLQAECTEEGFRVTKVK